MEIRDRIKSLRRVKANELIPHPKNWRVHTERQRKVWGEVMEKVGFAGAVLTRETDDGKLMVIDGHFRAEESGEAKIPVLVTDLSEQEAERILATFDPIGALATTDTSALDGLLASIGEQDGAIGSLLSELRGKASDLEFNPDSGESGFADRNQFNSNFIAQIQVPNAVGNDPEFKAELTAFCAKRDLKFSLKPSK